MRFFCLEPPKLPSIRYMSVRSYNKIYLRMNPFPNDDLEYNTTIIVREINKSPIINTIRLHNNYLSTNIENLQNGTTYLLEIVTTNYLGSSPALVVNQTIPRMCKL